MKNKIIGLAMLSALSGCNITAEDGKDGADAAEKNNLVDIVELAAGNPNCAYGGIAIYSGTDTDTNGTLEESERSNSKFVCNKDDVAPSLETTHDYSTEQLTQKITWTFSGKATDDNGVKSLTLKMNDQASTMEMAEDGSFTFTAPLKAGTNKFTLTATDQSNNTKTTNGTVYSGSTVAAGGSHSGAIQNGKLYTWGRNNYAQSGLSYNSEPDEQSLGAHPLEPKLVNSSITPEFVALSFNQNYSLAIDKNGDLWSWGYNNKGELGRGTIDEDCSLTSSSGACSKTIDKVNISNVVSVSAGYSHALALREDGSLWAWGTGGDGELANGQRDSENAPIDANQPTLVNIDSNLNLVQISAGSDFSCALEDQGNVWCWGKNNYGQMGQGNPDAKDDQLTPIKVKFPEGIKIKYIATGKGHALALTTDNEVYGWGLNASSQIGYNGYQYKGTENAWDKYLFTPTLILEKDTDNPVMSVFANGNSSYIIKADKKIYPWGQYGETDGEGKQSYNNLDFPEDKYTQIGNIKHVSAGALHLVAIQEDDTVFTFRWSFQGSLGGGESTVDRWFYNYPIKPTFPE